MRTDGKNRIHTLLALILAFVMVIGMVPVNARGAEDKSSSQIQKEIDALKKEKESLQSQISELQGQMSTQMDSMEAVVAQKNLIDQEIFLLYEQITNTNAQIMAYGVLIADKQAELDVAEANLNDLQQQNRARIRAMEKNSRSSYWSVIFQADDILDMLDRLKAMFKINQADQKLIKELSQAADEVTRVKEELQGQKDELEQTKKELEATQAELEAKRAEADELLIKLVTEYEAYEALVEEAEQNKANLNNEIGDLEDLYEAAKDQEYQKWYEQWLQSQPQSKPDNGGSAGTVTNGVTWLVPCSYVRISSPYGWRIHPIYGDYRFHHGIDLAAPAGTPIYATRSGKVTVATYSNSAGYYVNVDHGDGFMSRYLHMTHYVVSPGQQVSAGQLLGYVGNTGASKGNHLHLSIYYNGASVNPADYIKF